MLARRCDRCGTHYEINQVEGMGEDRIKVNRIELQRVKESETNCKVLNGKHFDLCPTCVDELRDWLKAGGMNEDL